MTYRPINRRSLLMLGGVAATGTALAACTSPNAPGSAGAGTGSGGSSRSKGSISLLLLGPTTEMTTYVTNTIAPAFEKSTGNILEVQTSDWGSAFQKVTTGAASNSLADVFMIGGIWTAPLADKNVLLDLTDRVKAWSDSSQFYPGMLADGVYKDRNYAVPISADVRPGVYRKDILDASGVSSLPTSWEEFRDAAVKIKAAGKAKTPIYWSQDKSIGLQQSFAILFLQAGGKYWDANGKASFSSEAGKKALTFMVQTFKDGLADVNQVYSGSGPMPLSSGESAMQLVGMAAYRNAQQTAKDVADKFVAGPGLKADSTATPLAVAWINKVAIAKNTKNPEGAWALVQTLSGKQYGADVTHLLDGLPTRKDLAEQPWIDSFGKSIVAASQTATSQPANPVMLQLGPAVKSLLEPAIRGQVSVDDTLKQIDDKVNSLNG